MKGKEPDYFKKLLLKKKKELEESLAALEEKFDDALQDVSSDLSAYPLHMADIGTDTEQREENSYLVESLVKELSWVNKALEKTYSKTYGICERCGNDIPKKRLKAIPYAEFCVKCLQKEKQ